MPDFPDVIQDLISKMLTVTVSERITIDQIKMHPAFRMYLPDNYTVPSPLPIPLMTEPMDPSTLDPAIMPILKHIGYSSDAEINDEFLAPEHTTAKVFYMMFKRNVSYESLPWPDMDNTPEIYIAPDEAFFMSPRMIPQTGMQTNDPFHRRIQAPDVSSPEIRSLAQRPDWYSYSMNQPGNQEEPIEQLFVDIPVPAEVLMARLQIYLSQNDMKFFHQSDMELIARSSDPNMIITFTASYESIEMLELSVSLKFGNKDEFDRIVNDLSNEILNMIHNYQPQF
ncbi:hypothetical protein TRFO_16192 [Tritrichomonas foetus]|uniref:CAMK family protein kinase n=1 Tax=Tritrichomonas foetus TaxID=1144522 RepID=A0A1J4KV63_9EUKA|nr:hypothetical protein TRFO_16192 [Tritrichomonas foetus]|eukprot:OHT13636.1 hypothetical protein TRFO_16192 [Tritrichomonas foetus]